VIGSGGDIVITVVRIQKGKVLLGIVAPPGTKVLRSELVGDGTTQKKEEEDRT
jgi:sRNA-binding carbon storage regulator CsrA